MSLMKGPLVLTVMALVVASCGSSGAEPDAVATTAVEAEALEGGVNTTATPAAPDAQAPDSSGGGQTAVSGLGIASVTIEGETYHFGDTGIAIQCTPDFFGVMMVALQMVDENGDQIPQGGGFGGALLHEGTDPAVVGQLNSIRFSLKALDKEWIADEEDIEALGLDPGSSQVDSVTVGGNTASGIATVYELNSYYAVQGGNADSVDVAQATFEITCADG
jgi:hypothetical protein